MKKLMEIKNSKAYKIVATIAQIMFVVILVGFIIVVCLQRFSDNKISFFNYRMFTVISGSMEPKYKIGDVLISKEVDPSTIKVGDAVSYLGTAGDFKDKVITHEVVSIKTDEDGKYLFQTKGLANLFEDPTISESQIYGVVIYRSIILSIIYRIVGTTIGFYLFIILPLLFIIGSEILSTMLEKEDERRKKISSN
jgi:signal peptidase